MMNWTNNRGIYIKGAVNNYYYHPDIVYKNIYKDEIDIGLNELYLYFDDKAEMDKYIHMCLKYNVKSTKFLFDIYSKNVEQVKNFDMEEFFKFYRLYYVKEHIYIYYKDYVEMLKDSLKKFNNIDEFNEFVVFSVRYMDTLRKSGVFLRGDDTKNKRVINYIMNRVKINDKDHIKDIIDSLIVNKILYRHNEETNINKKY